MQPERQGFSIIDNWFDFPKNITTYTISSRELRITPLSADAATGSGLARNPSASLVADAAGEVRLVLLMQLIGVHAAEGVRGRRRLRQRVEPFPAAAPAFLPRPWNPGRRGDLDSAAREDNT